MNQENPEREGRCVVVEQEALVVVVDTPNSHELLAELRRRARVTQVLPPRLALVVPRTDGPADLATMQGILVHTDNPPGLDGLAEGERLFVEAWWARRAGKSRRGDGLAWDAPGYLPPDPPATSTP